jgi:hypothetical protein
VLTLGHPVRGGLTLILLGWQGRTWPAFSFSQFRKHHQLCITAIRHQLGAKNLNYREIYPWDDIVVWYPMVTIGLEQNRLL